MNVFGELALHGGQALAKLLIHPLYYAGLLIVVVQYYRQMQLERKLFHTRLHAVAGRTWRAIGWGWLGGIFASLLMAFVGAAITPFAVLILWIASLLLFLFRIRFLCLAYAVGAVGTGQAVLAAFPQVSEAEGFGDLLRPFMELNVPALLAIVAILHFVEALYVRFQGRQAAMPLFCESKRGKIVGGYLLREFWPVPLFLVVPWDGGSPMALPWTPLFGADLWADGWTIAPFPVIIGFSALTMTRLPGEKARQSFRMLTAYSAVLLLMALSAYVWPQLAAVASLSCIVLHEAIIRLGRWDEARRGARFVHGPQGLTILAVLPNSAAAELGLAAGEIVHKVNGVKVRTKEELHRALQLNPAFCKLEIINLEGHSKFVQRAIYSGEHHQLGIVLAPDDQALYYVEEREGNLFSYLRKGLRGLLSARNHSQGM